MPTLKDNEDHTIIVDTQQALTCSIASRLEYVAKQKSNIYTAPTIHRVKPILFLSSFIIMYCYPACARSVRAPRTCALRALGLLLLVASQWGLCDASAKFFF